MRNSSEQCIPGGNFTRQVPPSAYQWAPAGLSGCAAVIFCGWLPQIGLRSFASLSLISLAQRYNAARFALSFERASANQSTARARRARARRRECGLNAERISGEREESDRREETRAAISVVRPRRERVRNARKLDGNSNFNRKCNTRRAPTARFVPSPFDYSFQPRPPKVDRSLRRRGDRADRTDRISKTTIIRCSARR